MHASDAVMPTTRRKVIVFGGDGFLGSHYVESLLALGHELTVFNHSRTGMFKNLGHLDGRFWKIVGDFADAGAVAASLKGQEVAVDFVMSSTPVGSWEEPLRTIESDLCPSVRFFELCARTGVRKIIFASSGGAIYGPHAGLLDESTVPHPFSPHSIIKLCTEHFLHYYCEKHGLAADCYRIGNVYGPRQPLDRPQGVIAAWIGRTLAAQPLDVFGDEKTIRDYIFVRDAAQLMTHSLRDLEVGETYNLGTGQGTSILELLDVFRSVVGGPVEYRLHPRRASDNSSSVLASDKLLRHFPGFVFHGLDEGIRESFEWARTRASSLSHGDGARWVAGAVRAEG